MNKVKMWLGISLISISIAVLAYIGINRAIRLLEISFKSIGI